MPGHPGLLVFFFTSVGLKDQFQCWENYVGQQMYNDLDIIFDFDINVTLTPPPRFLRRHQPFE